MGYGAYEDLRKDYDHSSLDEKDVDANPLKQFEKWFEQAGKAGVEEPNAMSLSTVDSEGKPHSRIVLIKGVTDNGIIFYTNYGSDKGSDLEYNSNVAVNFFWDKLQRQVRLEGVVKKISKEKSEQYFNARPYKSRLGALASEQSQKLSSREEMEANFKEFAEKYPENPPMPENWGGYEIELNYYEFWQGRPSRMHDRIIYKKADNEWEIFRLYP
jgi:pyridoxamine 5'-phosphate oxidase